MFKIGISYKTLEGKRGRQPRIYEARRNGIARAADDERGHKARKRGRKKKRDAIYYSEENSVRLEEYTLGTYIDATLCNFVVNDCNEPKSFMREISTSRAKKSIIHHRNNKL